MESMQVWTMQQRHHTTCTACSWYAVSPLRLSVGADCEEMLHKMCAACQPVLLVHACPCLQSTTRLFRPGSHAWQCYAWLLDAAEALMLACSAGAQPVEVMLVQASCQALFVCCSLTVPFGAESGSDFCLSSQQCSLTWLPNDVCGVVHCWVRCAGPTPELCIRGSWSVPICWLCQQPQQ